MKTLAAKLEAWPLENCPQEPPGAPFNYGCGLWLDIARTNGAAVLLTLHNTRPDQAYQIWSLEDLGQTNWVAETNLTGAAGDFTQVVIAMGQRSNLFFRESEARVYAVDTNASFPGLAYEDAQATAPDTMGAVGPNHFVEMVNHGIAVFPKTNSSRLQMMSTKDFFNMEVNGMNYLQEPTIDPSDDWSFWTVQAYADLVFEGRDWSTRISRLRPTP